MVATSSTLTREVKELVLSNDIDFVGIAPVERFENAPEGRRPTDLLPGAKSVISMGMRINLGVQIAQRISWANRKKLRHIKMVYRRFGYGVINEYFHDRASFKVTQFLESKGYLTIPIVASAVESQMMGAMSNRHAAVCAGLGEFGWNGLCLTPQAGPRNRFCTIVTTVELEPTPMYSGPKLCDVEKCKVLGGGQPICRRVCPAKAFSLQETNELSISGRKFHYAKLEKFKCLLGSYKNYLGTQDLAIPETADPKTVAEWTAQVHPLEDMEWWSAGRGHGCGLCLLRCPVALSPVVDQVMDEYYRSRRIEREEN